MAATAYKKHDAPDVPQGDLELAPICRDSQCRARRGVISSATIWLHISVIYTVLASPFRTEKSQNDQRHVSTRIQDG
jgi:hypothetical protein